MWVWVRWVGVEGVGVGKSRSLGGEVWWVMVWVRWVGVEGVGVGMSRGLVEEVWWVIVWGVCVGSVGCVEALIREGI